MEGSAITIRRLTPADSFDELTDLLHKSYAGLAAMGFRFVATHQSPAVTQERAGRDECYVAESEGRLVATVTFYPPGHSDGCPWYETPGVATLGQFAVLPEMQGQGIGSSLLRLMEQLAIEAHATELALDTAEGAAHLIQMYESHGFRLVEHVRWPETNYRSAVLSKQLTSGEPRVSWEQNTEC